MVVQALNAAGAEVSFAEITSDKGHDAFLLDEPDFKQIMGGFLQGQWERAG
jgi:homoserine O-acetyltransferase